jgi:hypothetical protein
MATAAFLAFAGPAAGQIPDHLRCYKVKDPETRATYTADLGGLTPGVGCVIRVPAKLACVPITKTNVAPTPPDEGGTGTSNPFFCYKVKCSGATPVPIPGEDQFGSRTVTASVTKLLCAPLAVTVTTTTTTTVIGPTTTLPFVDNGDGTVTDTSTGLQWEKKNGADGVIDFANPHDVDNFYTWTTGPGGAANGTAFTDFLSRLNACTSGDGTTLSGGFAGHCDWRLPTIIELQTILLEPYPCATSPCIDPVFGATGGFGGSISWYWSSTTLSGDATQAWIVRFDDGHVAPTCKNPLACDFLGPAFSVRAVRSGG